MPWMTLSGKQYDLCLLDTNIISEISKNKAGEFDCYFNKYPLSSNITCITEYSLIELRRNQEVYDKFIEVFSNIPFFLLKPFSQIFENEKEIYGSDEILEPLSVFVSPSNQDSRYHLKNYIDELFNNDDVLDSEKQWRTDETTVLQNWLGRIDNFEKSSDVANSHDAEQYVKDAGLQSIMFMDIEWAKSMVEAEELIDVRSFPSIVTMLYSQYYRLYDPHWKAEPQEITDISIIGVTPYMDVVVTEKYQAEIFKKIKSRVEELRKLDIATLRDIRNKN